MALDLEYMKYSHIRMIRLRATPEEFICTIVRHEDDADVPVGKIKVVDPMMPVNSGANQVGLMPWCMFSPKREFILDLERDVMLEMDVVPALAKGYIQQTTSIQTALADEAANDGSGKITPIL